jgi:hypothetical protein
VVSGAVGLPNRFGSFLFIRDPIICNQVGHGLIVAPCNARCCLGRPAIAAVVIWPDCRIAGCSPIVRRVAPPRPICCLLDEFLAAARLSLWPKPRPRMGLRPRCGSPFLNNGPNVAPQRGFIIIGTQHPSLCFAALLSGSGNRVPRPSCLQSCLGDCGPFEVTATTNPIAKTHAST